jgi:hypothetical protein
MQKSDLKRLGWTQLASIETKQTIFEAMDGGELFLFSFALIFCLLRFVISVLLFVCR